LVVSSAFSDGNSIVMGKVVFLPVNFNLDGLIEILEYESVFVGYANTSHTGKVYFACMGIYEKKVNF